MFPVPLSSVLFAPPLNFVFFGSFSDGGEAIGTVEPEGKGREGGQTGCGQGK